MRVHTITGALALLRTTLAFSDSSPWVLLSTSKIDQPPSVNQIETSSEAITFTKHFLEKCPTDQYLIITQPGVNAADFWTRDGCAMPHLCQAAKDVRVQGTYTVAEVVGDVTTAGFVQHIKASCERKGKEAKIIERPLESFSGERGQALKKNDDSIAVDLDMASSDSYTILFYASPREPLYDSEFVQPVHMDMRRGLDGATLMQRANKTKHDTRPLFEKYQFFTPGVFMGIVVAFVLLSILGAGIRGLASLQVSYGAFDKDMGPAAQKKQQ
ncbi:hypothetical protein E4U42_005977 [Claviceps africana]|uniref:Protein BIG1 n=1 Tax=Claviceps africana TaxID=83212 RepID=A0A8K0JHC7_9HYPO|nr:hypothetical protein E4U42_005977 [Claviceps africana]